MSQTVTWVRHRCLGCGFQLSAVKGAYACPKCDARMEPIRRAPMDPASGQQTPIVWHVQDDHLVGLCPNCGEVHRAAKGNNYTCPICGAGTRDGRGPEMQAGPQSFRDPDPSDRPPESPSLYPRGSLPLYPLVRIGVFLTVAVSVVLVVAGIMAMLDSSSRVMGLFLILGGVCGLPGAELLQLMLNMADDTRKSRLAIERIEHRES